jgi:hypothetical protein
LQVVVTKIAIIELGNDYLVWRAKASGQFLLGHAEQKSIQAARNFDVHIKLPRMKKRAFFSWQIVPAFSHHTCSATTGGHSPSVSHAKAAFTVGSAYHVVDVEKSRIITMARRKSTRKVRLSN